MARRFDHRGLFLAAAAAASAVALMLLSAPLYESGQTIIEADRDAVAWAIFVPLLVALLPLAVPAAGRRVAGYAAGGVLLAMSFLIMSVGPFFLMPAILLLVAAHTAPSRAAPSSGARGESHGNP